MVLLSNPFGFINHPKSIDFDALLMYFSTKKMNRQSISFTKPNDDWLKEMVASQEYSSKSELVNDLIRQARKQQSQIDWINSKLQRAEKSGYTDLNQSEILAESKAKISG